MKEIIEKFYNAFEKLDDETMIECYHPEIVFTDPAFGELKGERAKSMWRMLCNSQKGTDFKITFSDIKSGATKGEAKWEALYAFSKTGRNVHNKIVASFEFKDEKIIRHTDWFNLYIWAKQAMGFQGFLFGNTKWFKKKLNIQTNKLLDKFERKYNTV